MKVVQPAFKELGGDKSFNKKPAYSNCVRREVLTPVLAQPLVTKMLQLRFVLIALRPTFDYLWLGGSA